MKQDILHLKSGKQTLHLTESIEVLGLWIGQNDDKVDMQLDVQLDQPDLTCQIFLKIILFDSARISLKSNFAIGSQAKSTDSFLKVSALTCSPDCKIEVTPGMEIKTNYLKAGHGLSVSYLDPEQLFYLQSKGLNSAESEKLLIAAFAQEIIDRATPANKPTLLSEYAKFEK